MSMGIRQIVVGLFFLAAGVVAGLARADGDTRADLISQPMGDPILRSYEQAVAQSDWKQAASIMSAALAKNPNDSEYHNLYAFSLRKGSNPDMNLVFKHYNEALRLRPNHKGAHEYLGEAYLMVGNLPKAKEHLATIDKLCFFTCQEYRHLKAAIADYESKQARR